MASPRPGLLREWSAGSQMVQDFEGISEGKRLILYYTVPILVCL